jgi:hypothetical protein
MCSCHELSTETRKFQVRRWWAEVGWGAAGKIPFESRQALADAAGLPLRSIDHWLWAERKAEQAKQEADGEEDEGGAGEEADEEDEEVEVEEQEQEQDVQKTGQAVLEHWWTGKLVKSRARAKAQASSGLPGSHGR